MKSLKDAVLTVAVSFKKSDSVNTQLVSYWCKLFDQPLCSPQGFYTLVKENLGTWEVPALSGGYVDMPKPIRRAEKQNDQNSNRKISNFRARI